jgi:CarboxypepD_reg-like domain
LKSGIFKYILIVGLVWAGIGESNLQAQNRQDSLQIIQLTGMVMTQDSTSTIFGVHIYDSYGRGTTTNYTGWFSKAFLAGDTITFSAIGFKTAKVVVPVDKGTRYNIIVAMEEAVTQLADVEINPFPTEELFKEAILAMNLNEDQENVLNNFSSDAITEMVRTMPIDPSPSQNYRYMMNQQFYDLSNSAGPRSNPLLNPFAWAEFVNSFKKKKK